jgi:hypothetical protein
VKLQGLHNSPILVHICSTCIYPGFKNIARHRNTRKYSFCILLTVRKRNSSQDFPSPPYLHGLKAVDVCVLDSCLLQIRDRMGEGGGFAQHSTVKGRRTMKLSFNRLSRTQSWRDNLRLIFINNKKYWVSILTSLTPQEPRQKNIMVIERMDIKRQFGRKEKWRGRGRGRSSPPSSREECEGCWSMKSSELTAAATPTWGGGRGSCVTVNKHEYTPH